MAKTIIREKFGKRLKQLRKEKGYSQEALADAVGIHRTYIGNIERGEESISLDNLYRIAKAMKMELSELLEKL